MAFWCCFSRENRGLVGEFSCDGEGAGEYEDMVRDDNGDEIMLEVALLAMTRRPVFGLAICCCIRFMLDII